MLARLTVHFPLQPTRSFLLRNDGERVVGRDPDCDVVLDDDRVSRRHARLAFVEGVWRLTDLESKNGTAVDGRTVRDAALGGSGWISFGGLLARFEISTEEREQAETRRREQRWRTSISMQRALSPALPVEQLLERLLDSVLALSGAARGFVLLRRADGELSIVARRHLADAELETGRFSGSVGAIQRAVESGRPVAVSDAQLDSFLKRRDSVVAEGIRALVCVPLRAIDRSLGVIYADRDEPGAAFDELDVEILEALASHAALALAVASLDRELKGLLAATGAERGSKTWTAILTHHRIRDGADA